MRKTDLSKFYKPITETQKATAREITGLRPIREGIENLPQAITFPPMQPLGEASGKEEQLHIGEIMKTLRNIGEIAKEYLDTPLPDHDTMFRLRKREGLYYLGNSKLLSLITIL